jgi:hypothetical protein
MPAPKPPARGGGGIMKAKVGPVPVPILIAGAVAVVVYLYFRHRASGSSSSAGSSSTPDVSSVPQQLYPSGDSTGGGAGGLDLSSLLDALAQNTAQLGYLSSLTPVSALPTAGGAPPTPAGLGAAGASTGSSSDEPQGGNTAPPVTATQPSAPTSTYAGFTSQSVPGGLVYTPSQAEAKLIDSSPNALRTIGSDAGQVVVPNPKPKPAAKVTGYGGNTTAGQVRRNL